MGDNGASRKDLKQLRGPFSPSKSKLSNRINAADPPNANAGENAKKPSLFKRLRSRSLKKQQTVDVTEGSSLVPIQPEKSLRKKSSFFTYHGRSRSQPDLVPKPADSADIAEEEVFKAVISDLKVSPGGVQQKSPMPKVSPSGVQKSKSPGSPDVLTPRRSQSAPKRSNRLTPVEENAPEPGLTDDGNGLGDDDNTCVEKEDSFVSALSSGGSAVKVGQLRQWSRVSLVQPSRTKDEETESSGGGSERTDTPPPVATELQIKGLIKSDQVEPTETKKPLQLTRGQSASRLQSWINSVTIFLYEGKDLPPMDRNGFSDPFCKFKLGADKHKSRTAYKTLNPRWMEQFDLFIYDPEHKDLEITVWDWDRGMRNDYIGKASINLATLEDERSHDLWLNVVGNNNNEPCGSLHLSVMISGKKLLAETSLPEENKPESSSHQNRTSGLAERYNVRNSLTDMGDVGLVSVKVFRGCGLRAADLNGKSDPYCVLQLVNARLQTQVEPKTLDPEWNRIFTFPVNDVHSVLEISVLDMDQDKKSDFLGRVSVPLLGIRNNERRWYALKDDKLMGRAKGSILLEMELVYNPIRAAYRTVNPREARFDDVEPKFKRQIFVRNVSRIRSICSPLLEAGHFIRSCFNWESKKRSIMAFIVYVISVYFFEVWMLPVLLLLLFLKHYILLQLVQATYARELRDDELAEYADDEGMFNDDDDLEDDPNRLPVVVAKITSSNNLVAKLRIAQEQLRFVQNTMGFIADLFERIQNTFQFAVPWLSYYGVIILCVATVILYFVPLRVIFLIWGVNKFTKKLRKPNSLGNNELLDFLSRMHTIEEIKMYRELRPREVSGGVPVGLVADATLDHAPYRRASSRTKLL